MDKALFDFYLKRLCKERGPHSADELKAETLRTAFLKRLAMGFTVANAARSKKSPENRATAALQTLLGTTSPDPRAEDDDVLLEQMAVMEIASLEAGRDIPTVAKLATAVAHRAAGNSKTAITKRLARKYRGRRAQFLSLANDKEADFELVLRGALWDIERILKRFGVEFWSEL